MHAKHSQDERIINYIYGSTCQVCMMDYWTADRLFKHMCASRQCASFTMQLSKRLDDDTAADISEEIRIIRRTNKNNGLPEDYAERP
eukprot:8603418-Pyramimonas_sp.AAC.1